MTKKYQALARKYRPQTFGEVCGQAHIVTTLKNAIRLHRIAHAYLFTGTKGTGKTSLARLFAKALNCENRSLDSEPCNRCSSCIEITEGRSLDVLEIDGASNRGIDDIRNLNETAGYSPSRGVYKIYIIDEVHMLTKEAFNALLKTLEEPPPSVKFFFATTEPHKIPATILSRCQRFDLKRIAQEEITTKLTQISEDLNLSVDKESLSLIAKYAEGSMRDAQSLLDQVLNFHEGNISKEILTQSLGITDKEMLFAFDQAAAKKDLSFAFTLANQIYMGGKNFSAFLDTLMEHFAEILKFQMGLSNQAVYEKSSKTYTKEQCVYILEYLFKQAQELPKSSFKKNFLEMILLHLLKSLDRIPIESLVRRLIDLENSIQEPESKPPKAAPPPPEVALPPPVETKKDYDTLLQFSAVELNGIVKK